MKKERSFIKFFRHCASLMSTRRHLVKLHNKKMVIYSVECVRTCLLSIWSVITKIWDFKKKGVEMQGCSGLKIRWFTHPVSSAKTGLKIVDFRLEIGSRTPPAILSYSKGSLFIVTQDITYCSFCWVLMATTYKRIDRQTDIHP